MRFIRTKTVELNPTQEKLLADKLFDLANYFAVGFIISQIASDTPSFLLLIAGAVLYIIFGIIAVRLRR